MRNPNGQLGCTSSGEARGSSAGIGGAAKSDHTLKKENIGKAAIILLQVTFVPNTSQTTEDLP